MNRLPWKKQLEPRSTRTTRKQIGLEKNTDSPKGKTRISIQLFFLSRIWRVSRFELPDLSSRAPHSSIAFAFLLLTGAVAAAARRIPDDASPRRCKGAWFQQDLLDKHWLDGLYVSIVPAAPPGTKLEHTVEEPGNVIHAGVWTGRYLAGVGYQYAVTRDPWV